MLISYRHKSANFEGLGRKLFVKSAKSLIWLLNKINKNKIQKAWLRA